MSIIEQLFSLRGKSALVTGAGTGLGAEMATALASAGAKILLIGRRAEKLNETRLRIEASGGYAKIIAADLCIDADYDTVLNDSYLAENPIDILVNAAGVNYRKPAEELSRQEWDNTLHLNLTVPFLLGRALAEGMVQRGWGRIINLASLQSVRAFPNSMPYGASKGGIMQLTRAMAEAWSASGVCSNAIAPSLFPTELTQAIYQNPQAVNDLAQRTCCNRNAELSDIWGLTLFLASPASDFITGQTLFLDGGFTAK